MPENQAIAAREVLAPRGKAWAPLAEQQALLADGALEVRILRRVDHVDAAGEHRDGAAFERGKVRRGVDAARQP
jgi:hypothetical protein